MGVMRSLAASLMEMPLPGQNLLEDYPWPANLQPRDNTPGGTMGAMDMLHLIYDVLRHYYFFDEQTPQEVSSTLRYTVFQEGGRLIYNRCIYTLKMPPEHRGKVVQVEPTFRSDNPFE